MDLAQNKGARPRRVLVIGFDGATLDLIRPWAAAGLLPNFQRLMERGAWGELQSTMPPVTPAAWSSMATGTNQGKHGLFDFYARREGSYETYVVNARDRHGATIWDLLSQAGYRVTVFNVPATYPPDPVNGVMISGFLTPAHAEDASYPVEVLNELKQAVPDFGFYPPAIFSRGDEVEFIADVLEWDRVTLQATEFLMDRQPWDFFFTVFTGVDILCHWMWRHMVTEGACASSSDPETRDALARGIQDVYRQADGILGRLLQAAGNETCTMVVSDHGFGPLNYYMHLNTWLLRKGYLKFKRTPFVLLKYLAFRLGITPIGALELLRALRLGGKVQQVANHHKDWLNAMISGLFLAMTDVDWSRTMAYSAGYGGPIFVNLKGRHPHGIVEPGVEYEALLERLTADLLALRHTGTNEAYVGEIYRPSRDLYSGPFAHRGPDLMFEPRDWANQGFGVHDFAFNRWLQRTPDRTGTHRMNGILFLDGPGIRPGCAVQGAALTDLAPTVLALMDVPIPETMDGTVLRAPLSEELYSRLNIRYTNARESAQVQSDAPPLSEDEERELRERLEALGYFG